MADPTPAGHAATVRYAEQSKEWTHGQKSEDELLQRIWNLATDVTRLAARADELEREREEARTVRDMFVVSNDELLGRVQRAEAALREIERMAGAAGAGETPAQPIAQVARAALGEQPA